MKKQPRPKDLPLPKDVAIMLQNWDLHGVQVYKGLEKSFLKIYKDHNIRYEILDQYYREDFIFDHAELIQDLPHWIEIKLLKDDSNAHMRKLIFSRWSQLFGFKNHGISAKYNFCEIYNLRIAEYWKDVTLEWKTGGFLIKVTPKMNQ